MWGDARWWRESARAEEAREAVCVGGEWSGVWRVQVEWSGDDGWSGPCQWSGVECVRRGSWYGAESAHAVVECARIRWS